MNRQQFNTVKIGIKVGFVYRDGQLPQNNQGTIAAKIEDWQGFHLDVHGDDGNRVSVKKFVDKGNGCYLFMDGYETGKDVRFYLVDEGVEE